MQVNEFLHKKLATALPGVHATRMAALFDTVTAVVNGAPLSLSGLGRALSSPAKVKHLIKKVDRLLGNPHLQAERFSIYQAVARPFLRQEREPVVLVDWSHADDRKRLFILRAALVLKGRSVPLLEAAHDRDNCPRFQAQFLKHLAETLPSSCRPVVITDAGFGCKWFAAIAALGWSFVGRVRNREHFASPGRHDWRSVTQMTALACARPHDAGFFEMTQRRFPVRVVVYKALPKGRVYRGRTGKPSADTRSRQCAKRAVDPWLLVCSSDATWRAKRVVQMYARRMRIEEGFRDTKSRRYGLGLEEQACQTPARLNILLLIAALALYAVLLAGLLATGRGHARSYQANTGKGSVLSLVSIGRQWLRRPESVTSNEWALVDRERMALMRTAAFLT